MVHKSFSNFFQKYPIAANAVSGFCIFAFGDILSQSNNLPSNSTNTKGVGTERSIREIGAEIDFRRSLYCGMYGIGLNGVFLTKYYRILERTFGTGQNLSTVGKKIVVDELFGAPIFLCAFFAMTSSYRKVDEPERSFEELFSRFKDTAEDKLVISWMADACVWPSVNFITFRYIPLNMRPTFVGCCQLVWNYWLAGYVRANKENNTSSSSTSSSTSTGVNTSTVYETLGR
jgi:hypothetical protein